MGHPKHNDLAPTVDATWFWEVGLSADEAAVRWSAAPRKTLKELFLMCTDLSESTIRNHFSGFLDPNSKRNRAHKVGARQSRKLDFLMRSLGLPKPPLPAKIDRRSCKIVFLADLADVPSPRYHLAILNTLAEACDKTGRYSTTIRAIPAQRKLADYVHRVLVSEDPDALVFLRRTPDEATLKHIGEFGQTKVVLVHCARLQYPDTVTAEVQPDQSSLSTLVRRWLEQGTRPSAKGRARTPVVIAAMKPEDSEEWKGRTRNGIEPSIREERVQMCVRAVDKAGLRWVVERMPDYSAAQGVWLSQKYSDSTFITLSDDVAVALFFALKLDAAEASRRILGFDGSPAVARHGIPSISQSLDEIGNRVIEALDGAAPRNVLVPLTFQPNAPPVAAVTNSAARSLRSRRKRL